MVRRLAALACLVALAATGCGGGGRPAAGGTGKTFPEMFRAVQPDFEPAPTFDALAKRSEVVAVGRLESIVEGRVLGTSPDDPSRIEHMVMTFTVDRVLAGRLEPGADRVHVEYAHSQAYPASAFQQTAPLGARAVLYLVPAPADAGQPVVDPRAGLPAGRTLRWFTTPQGFLVEVDGRVTNPLRQVDVRELFTGERPDPADLASWLPARLRGGFA